MVHLEHSSWLERTRVLHDRVATFTRHKCLSVMFPGTRTLLLYPIDKDDGKYHTSVRQGALNVSEI